MTFKFHTILPDCIDFSKIFENLIYGKKADIVTCMSILCSGISEAYDEFHIKIIVPLLT